MCACAFSSDFSLLFVRENVRVSLCVCGPLSCSASRRSFFASDIPIKCIVHIRLALLCSVSQLCREFTSVVPVFDQLHHDCAAHVVSHYMHSFLIGIKIFFTLPLSLFLCFFLSGFHGLSHTSLNVRRIHFVQLCACVCIMCVCKCACVIHVWGVCASSCVVD